MRVKGLDLGVIVIILFTIIIFLWTMLKFTSNRVDQDIYNNYIITTGYYRGGEAIYRTVDEVSYEKIDSVACFRKEEAKLFIENWSIIVESNCD